MYVRQKEHFNWNFIFTLTISENLFKSRTIAHICDGDAELESAQTSNIFIGTTNAETNGIKGKLARGHTNLIVSKNGVHEFIGIVDVKPKS